MRIHRTLTVLTLLACLALAACSGDPQARRAAFIESAEEYAAQGDHQEAVLQYLNALKIDPSHIGARFGLAESYKALEQHNSAFEQFRRVLDLDADNLQAKLEVARYMLAATDAGNDRFVRAQELAEQILNQDPSNLEARILLGNSLAGLSQFEQSVEEMQRVLASDPGNLTATLNLGAFRMGMRDPDEAERIFRQAVEEHPDSPEAHRALANLHLYQRDFQQAEESFLKAFDLEPASPVNLNWMLRLYMLSDQREKLEGVILRSKEAAEATGDLQKTSWPRFVLANYYASEDRSDEAASLLEGLMEDFPDNRTYALRLAEMYINDDQLEGVEGVVATLLSRNEQDAEGIYLRGRLRLLQDDRAAALADFDRAVELKPSLLPAHLYKASVHLSQGELAVAKASVMQVLRQSPDHLQARSALARILAVDNDYEQALQEAEGVLERDPDDLDSNLAKAEALLGLRRLDEAEEIYEELAGRRPDNPLFPHRMGTIEIIRGNADAALRHLEEAIQIAPDSTDILNDIAKALTEAGRHQEALRRLDQALAESQQPKFLHLYKSRVLGQIEELDAAKRELEKALEIDESFSAAYVSLAQINVQQGNLDQALNEVGDLLEKRPEFSGGWFLKAIYLEKLERFDEAADAYREAIKADRDSIEAANNLAYLLAERDGDLQEALQLASEARRRRPSDPEIADTLGWVQYKRENFGQAVDLLLFSVNNRNQPQAVHYYRLGMAYMGKGDSGEARSALSKALELDPQFKEADEVRRLLRELS